MFLISSNWSDEPTFGTAICPKLSRSPERSTVPKIIQRTLILVFSAEWEARLWRRIIRRLHCCPRVFNPLSCSLRKVILCLPLRRATFSIAPSGVDNRKNVLASHEFPQTKSSRVSANQLLARSLSFSFRTMPEEASSTATSEQNFQLQEIIS